MHRSRLLPIAAAAGLSVVGARTVQAQAWLPPKGEVAVTLGYSRAFADQHIDWTGQVVTLPYQGNALGLGTMTWNSVDSDLSYGITDRMAVRMSLPFVVSRYVGAFPHIGLPGHQNIDDESWHGTFQDLVAEVRFKATRGTLVVTPLLGVSVPTHSYEYFGHAAAGRDVAEGRVGVSVGRLLGPALPNAYAQARYTFAVPEKAFGISHDRSNLSFDVGYFVIPALTVSVIGDWQKTHGGWRVPVDFPMDANIVYHDKLARSDYFRVGGAASYALTGSIDVSVNAYASPYVRSEVNMAGFGVNVTYSFSPSQIVKRSKTPGHASVRARSSS